MDITLNCHPETYTGNFLAKIYEQDAWLCNKTTKEQYRYNHVLRSKSILGVRTSFDAASNYICAWTPLRMNKRASFQDASTQRGFYSSTL